MIGRRIRVSGLVQGVGFRPHVWRLAKAAGLTGRVANDGAGVEIDVWGDEAVLDDFLIRLRDAPPPLARIEAIDWRALPDGPAPRDLRIAPSGAGRISTGIVADAATCPQCLAEIRDPADRRYRYPFTNCTHCGPRLSIVRAIPYDRANTSMQAFTMCARCAAEYRDPADRRFHAQPNACPDCGPRLWLEDRDGPLEAADPIAEAARRLKAGAIVAIKGIGGFHLACDAANAGAVAELRRRKARHAKPFALMARDLDQIRLVCRVEAGEAAQLQSPAAPIVLLDRLASDGFPGVAPGQARIGVMLPYTPLHHLFLMALDGPAVMTSGNRSDEPQVTGNAEARQRLSAIADLWLMHDRDIVNRLDDSVVRHDVTGPLVLRRARGLAPAPLTLPDGFAAAPPVLALGGELKAAFCLADRGRAIVSQHIGDLKTAAADADFRAGIALYRDLFRFDPAIIAVDAHPDYRSTLWGEKLARETGAALARVQHHHAHLASCLAEHGIAPGDDRTLGIILDGLGLGPDGTLWGGEILSGGYAGFERLGHLLPVALPGGERAARDPWRDTVAHLRTAFGADWFGHVADTGLGRMLAEKPLSTIDRMIERGVNAPVSSSAGRLFDAVAAAVGLCFERQHYEGQAAMELEALALPHLGEAGAYPVAVGHSGGVRILSWAPLWAALVGDLRRGAAPGLIAARFHLGLIEGLAECVAAIGSETGLRRIVLSGGVLQNRILAEALHRRLGGQGFEVLLHARVPANDGGLSLGQAVIAAARCDVLRSSTDGSPRSPAGRRPAT